jgi:hypothetical protein
VSDQTSPDQDMGLVRRDISFWLAACAQRIETPFKRQKFRKSLGDVAIGVEVYVMRYNRELACIEYTLYWPALAAKCFEWKNAPALTRRMMDTPRAGGDLVGDIYLSRYRGDRAAMESEIVRQGENLFHNVNSASSFLDLLLGRIREVPGTPNELKYEWPRMLDQIKAAELAGVSQ